MRLGEKQRAFAWCVHQLIGEIYRRGYEISFGDAYRDPRVFGGWGTAAGYGSGRSLHKRRLAIDLNLFKDGRYLRSTEAHRQFGEFWIALGVAHGYPLQWGGSNGRNDGNHYSFGHAGRW